MSDNNKFRKTIRLKTEKQLKNWNAKNVRQFLEGQTNKNIKKTSQAIDFKNIKITQDDMWFLHKYFTQKGTRESKFELIPKFIELLKKNL